jgi:hypothetical protein
MTRKAVSHLSITWSFDCVESVAINAFAGPEIGLERVESARMAPMDSGSRRFAEAELL